MEKMTEMESLCEAVVLELIEIKMHICNGRAFEGGFGLGGLINSLLYRQDEEKKIRSKDKECEEDEEYDDDELAEQEDEYDYELMYNEKCEDFVDLKKENIDRREENKKLKAKLEELTNLIRKLFNEDHIYPNSREEVRNELLKSEELTDGFDGKIVEKNHGRCC